MEKRYIIVITINNRFVRGAFKSLLHSTIQYPLFTTTRKSKRHLNDISWHAIDGLHFIVIYSFEKSYSEPTNLLGITCFQTHYFLIRTAGKLNVFLLLFLRILTAAIAALYHYRGIILYIYKSWPSYNKYLPIYYDIPSASASGLRK